MLTSTYSEAFTDYKTFHFEFNAVAFDDAVISLRDGVSIVGTTGDDDLRGFDTDDHDGSTYDDTLVGLAGNDTLYGGEGNDTLIGGPGRDLQFGGGGDDTYLLRPGDGDVRSEGDASPIGYAFEQVGQGQDTIRIAGVAQEDVRIWSEQYMIGWDSYWFLVISLPDGSGGRSETRFQRDLVGRYESWNTGLWSRYERILFDDGSQWNAETGIHAIGLESGQYQLGTIGDDHLEGRGGDDELHGGDGDDTLDGGEGDDTLVGNDGDDLLIGGAGFNRLYGQGGDDTYLLRPGDGEASTDSDHYQSYSTESVGQGLDTIRVAGVAPEDLRIWSELGAAGAGSTWFTVFSLPDGEGGRSDFRFERDLVAFRTTAIGFWDRYERVEFDDGTVWTEATGLHAIGRETADRINGTTSGDRLEGRGGDDTLEGGEGDDTLDGGEGDDRVGGGGGDDILIFSPGLDRLNGNAGDDTYVLRPGGGETDDGAGYLKGYADESLDGYLAEAQGDDTIRIEGVAPGDLRMWSESLLSSPGSFTTRRTLTFSLSDDDEAPLIFRVLLGTTGYGIHGSSDFWEHYERIVFDDGTVWTAATGYHAIGLDTAQRTVGTVGDDTLEGRAGDDTLDGQAGDDLLDGGDDSDALYGGDGDDTLLGGAANDWLFGQDDDDTLVGGSGTDTLFGGDGEDEFRGSLAEMDGDSIGDLTLGDAVVFEGVSFDASRLSFQANRTRMVVDLQGDGSPEATVNVAGSFDPASVRVVRAGADTVVAFGNRAPEAADDLIRLAPSGGTVSGSVTADLGAGADRDPDGDPLRIAAVNGSAALVGTSFDLAGGGRVRVNADGRFWFVRGDAFADMVKGETRETGFAYLLSDGVGGLDEAEVRFVISRPNAAPVARDDAFATNPTATFSRNVLADNGAGADADPDGDPIRVASVDGAAASVGERIDLAGGGAVRVLADGTFWFVPDGDFADLARGQTRTTGFDYAISDGFGGTASARATVAVTAPNHVPVARDDAFAAGRSGVLSRNVLADNGAGADRDADGDPLRVTSFAGSAAQVGRSVDLADGGRARLMSDGTFWFDPDGDFDDLVAGQSRVTSFGYAVSDGFGGTASATARITVSVPNAPPTAADDAFAANPTATLSRNLLADNGAGPDRDPEGQAIRVASVEGLEANVGERIDLAGGGAVRVMADGTFWFVPDGDFDDLPGGGSRPTGFDYAISDGHGGTDTARVTFTVSAPNRAPVAKDDAFATNPSATYARSVFADNGAGADTDPDGHALSVSAFAGSAANVGQRVDLQDGGAVRLMADGRFWFVPDGDFDDLLPGQSRVASFGYAISDGHGGTASATARITVTAPNAPPVARDDHFALPAGGTRSGNLLADHGEGPDLDADGGVLRIVAANGAPGLIDIGFDVTGGGRARVLADGTFWFVSGDDFDGLGPDETARVSFDYALADGQGGFDVGTAWFEVG
ncbi:MAG: Ig-like domain-containing protein [Pseudomonadota bacterium]|nr:Ig-like domain-containing protein [Pseudomonadota bacterium]